jgi:hypothetical protein
VVLAESGYSASSIANAINDTVSSVGADPSSDQIIHTATTPPPAATSTMPDTPGKYDGCDEACRGHGMNSGQTEAKQPEISNFPPLTLRDSLQSSAGGEKLASVLVEKVKKSGSVTVTAALLTLRDDYGAITNVKSSVTVKAIDGRRTVIAIHILVRPSGPDFPINASARNSITAADSNACEVGTWFLLGTGSTMGSRSASGTSVALEIDSCGPPPLKIVLPQGRAQPQGERERQGPVVKPLPQPDLVF